MTATLAERVLAGDARAIARAITHIENDDAAAGDLVADIFNHTGRDFFAFKDIRKNQQKSKYKNWYVIDGFDDPQTQRVDCALRGPTFAAEEQRTRHDRAPFAFA